MVSGLHSHWHPSKQVIVDNRDVAVFRTPGLLLTEDDNLL